MGDTPLPPVRTPKEIKARQVAVSRQIRGLLEDLQSTWLSHHMIDQYASEVDRLLKELVALAHDRKGPRDNAM